MIILYYSLWSLVALAIVQSFDPLGATISALSFAGTAIYTVPCHFWECCTTDTWIPANITQLELSLLENVYGQHLVREIVVSAFRSHYRADLAPNKALALSFHGWPGGGKNFVSSFIVNSVYREGFKSKYVHLFSGLIHFPLQSQADIYKLQLIDWVHGNVSKCERSIFIFDEVDKMHERILDGIKPYMDHHERIKDVDFRKATFIFLSNTGGNLITEQMITLWQDGKKREQLKLWDFEDLIRKGAFNEKGGFHHSEAIESNLIDHYVPFLPLERKHVTKCIEDEFRRRKHTPTIAAIQEVLKEVTFGPEPTNLYAIAGCKRVGQKVATIVEREMYYRRTEL